MIVFCISNIQALIETIFFMGKFMFAVSLLILVLDHLTPKWLWQWEPFFCKIVDTFGMIIVLFLEQFANRQEKIEAMEKLMFLL